MPRKASRVPQRTSVKLPASMMRSKSSPPAQSSMTRYIFLRARKRQWQLCWRTRLPTPLGRRCLRGYWAFQLLAHACNKQFSFSQERAGRTGVRVVLSLEELGFLLRVHDPAACVSRIQQANKPLNPNNPQPETKPYKSTNPSTPIDKTLNPINPISPINPLNPWNPINPI